MTDKKTKKPRAKKGKKPAISAEKALAMASTPAEEITPETIADLRPAGYNPRVISTEQQDMLRASMQEYGDIGGIVFNVKTGRTVGGHQRVKQLDPAWQIVKGAHTDETGTVAIGYIETPHGRFNYREVSWSEKKEKGANIAANKMGGMFDDEMLTELLKDLNDTGYDMSLTGFDEAELNALIGEPEEEGLGEEDPDVNPAANPFVQLGDLWICGESRLICGDSTSIADIDKLMMGEKADLCWTDPPYNVDYSGKGKSLQKLYKREVRSIKNDASRSDDEFLTFLKSAFSAMAHALRCGGCFYITCPVGPQELNFQLAIRETKGLKHSQSIIWVKNHHALSGTDYNGKHEPIQYGWKEGAAHYFNGDFSQNTVIDDDVDLKTLSKPELLKLANELRQKEPSTVIRVDKPAKSDIHPTMKPVRLVERCLYASSRPGDIVIDLFNGGGTTLIACRKTGRKYRGSELTPGYTQATLQRYWDYCKEEPQLVGPKGELIPFSKVKKQRQG